MKRLVFLAGATIALVFGTLVSAQTATPAFDVISIRPADPGPVMRSADFNPIQPGGGFRDSHIRVDQLIAGGWSFRDTERHLLGLPKEIREAVYSISAKAAPDFPVLSAAENEKQVRLMLRKMLEDRFHLRAHMETRDEKVFKLGLAKSGLKLQEVPAPVPPQKEGFTYGYGEKDGGGRILGEKTTMPKFATALTIMLGRRVIDETGLKSFYTFDVKWPGDPAVSGADFGSSEYSGFLLSMLRDRFGLQLTDATAPGEFLVVDHIEAPTEN